MGRGEAGPPLREGLRGHLDDGDPGGSDLGANRTLARREGEAYRLYSGDKYFASGAGLADYALVTARPEGAPEGPKGLGLFLLPREMEGRLNFTVRRFKEKLATRAVPSGEVELEGSLAYPIGRPRRASTTPWKPSPWPGWPTPWPPWAWPRRPT